MKIRLKFGSALLIFVTSMANAFALDLAVTNDGTATGGNIQVFNSQGLVGSCALPACDASLATLPGDQYTIIATPAIAATDVVTGFSDCPQGGTAVGNSCTFFLDADAEVFVTFDLRNRFTIYDQDADGIDDLTEFALDANPLAFDDYPDTDGDGLQDIIETQVTHTDINTNDSATCSGNGVLTGQWDVRWIDATTVAGGHDLTSATDTKKEWAGAFSICHTGSNVEVFDQYYGYASTVTFESNTLNITFTDPQDGDTVIIANYEAGLGLHSKGRFEDLNATIDGSPAAQLRADRRMELADLASLTAANISGTFAAQLAIYSSATDEIIDKPYNPLTSAVDFRATENSGKVMTVKLYSIGQSGNANATRGYFVPSVATFYSTDRSIAETNIDLDADGPDDQTFDHSLVSMTFVEAPVSGIGGMVRGELENQEIKDFDSDFTNDGFDNGSFANFYAVGTQPIMSAFTLNVENSSGGTAVESRISLINTQLSAETATIDTPTTSGDPLFDNLDGNPATNSGNYISTNNRIEGYSNGVRVGSHYSSQNNGTNLSFKPGLLEHLGLYTINFTGDQLTGTSLNATYTDNTGAPLPAVTKVKIDNASLSTSRSKPRLINTDTSHTLKWNRPAASGIGGSTGADLYRVQLSKRNGTVGFDDSSRLETYVSCTSGTCSLTLPKNSFDPDATYKIKILAFDNADDTNRSISAAYYVNTASKLTGCSNNSTNSNVVTNGSPCAEYFQVQNPRIYDNAGTDAPTFLDYAVNRPMGTPKGIVVLFTGGSGSAVIIGNPTSKTTKQVGLNFLVRSAEMFADQGYLAVTIDSPSDKKLASGAASYLYDDYRVSPALAQDIASVLNEVNTQNLNVFLAGTSRGGISVLNQFKVANAISMSVPVNSNAFYYTDDPSYVEVAGDHPVGQTGEGEIAPGDVYVPVHYLVNPDETCGVTVPTVPADPTMFNSFANSGQNLFDSISTSGNGVTKIGSACKSMHDHGFLGSELAAVTATTNWFDTLLTGNRPPLARPIRQLVLPDTATTFAVANLSAVAFDPDGDPIDVDVASATSTRGGTFSESTDPVGLTYTPPSGADNITDAIVFVIEDDKGGRTSMVMTIDISADADGNGIPDSSTIYSGDATSDADGDGLTLLQEYQAGTNPDVGGNDTDGDGFSDSFEILNGLNPTVFNDPNFDSDSDGFTDGEEAAVGSNLFDASINPGFISLTDATPSVQEDVGTASISVTRSGGTFGAVSVDCISSDLSATAGTDYTAINTTLNWANGDATAKSCDVTITADSDTEGDETFKLDISNPTAGAKLGTP